jgi:hypothetical protein
LSATQTSADGVSTHSTLVWRRAPATPSGQV